MKKVDTDTINIKIPQTVMRKCSNSRTDDIETMELMANAICNAIPDTEVDVNLIRGNVVVNGVKTNLPKGVLDLIMDICRGIFPPREVTLQVNVPWNQSTKTTKVTVNVTEADIKRGAKWGATTTFTALKQVLKPKYRAFVDGVYLTITDGKGMETDCEIDRKSVKRLDQISDGKIVKPFSFVVKIPTAVLA